MLKNYMCIKNDGLIYPEDIKLIGSSTKRGVAGKIGQFGSGWKYALAWLLRNQLTIKIFSGLEEIEVDFTVKMHRDMPVKVLTVNGEETSITSGMGEIDWKGWMALREIVSNAIDEGGDNVTSNFNPEFKGEEGKVTIYVEMNGELAEVLANYNDYFSFNITPVYSNSKAQLFTKKTGQKSAFIYRKGIRCYEINTGGFNINFNNIDINESRLANDYSFKGAFADFIKELDDVSILVQLLSSFPVYNFPDFCNEIRELVTKLCTTNKIVPLSLKENLGVMAAGLVIPNSWYKAMRDAGVVEDIFEKLFGKRGGGDYYITKELSNIAYHLGDMFPRIKVFQAKFVESTSCTYERSSHSLFITEELAKESVSRIFADFMYHSNKTILEELYEEVTV